MHINFLGTSAGLPTRERNVTSYYLDFGGQIVLVDAGEGTQRQMIEARGKVKGTKITPSKVDVVLITHKHMDHILGLPGMLSTASSQGREKKMIIIAPKGVKEWVEHTMEVTQTYLTFPIEYHETNVDQTYRLDALGCTVTAKELHHDVPSYAYHLQFDEQPGGLNAKKASELGAKGKELGQLKNGRDVVKQDGTIIYAKHVLAEPKKGRSLLVCGDTKYHPDFENFPKDIDLLVYEGTLSGTETEGVLSKYMHSTYQQAATLGKTLRAKRVFINHISGRYQEDELVHMQNEAQQIYDRAIIVKDFDSFKF